MTPLQNHNISLASSVAIAHHMSLFGNKTVQEWLSAHHPAKNGQIVDVNNQRPIRKLDHARQVLSDDEMASLVAACAPCHCLDGWGFLARAVGALVARDSHSAKHFAYYAQLRATMSILAISGIGIFNGLNICVDSNGGIHKLEDSVTSRNGKGTHSIVWPALAAWAESDRNAEALLTSVCLHGTNTFEAIQSIWPSRQPVSIVAPLMQAWTFDLAIGTQHHQERNISSYSPHYLNKSECSFDDEMNFVAQLWDTLEPSVTNGFAQLDEHLLRRLLQMIHEQDNNNLDCGQSSIQLNEGSVATRYDELAPTLKQAVFKSFLLDEEKLDEPQLFALADDRAVSAKSMISRAVLLLRAATAMNAKILDQTPFSLERLEVRPWLDPIVVDRGIARVDQLPERMADLWDETKFALEDFRTALSESGNDPYGFLNSYQNGTPVVTQFERAAMWGIIS